MQKRTVGLTLLTAAALVNFLAVQASSQVQKADVAAAAKAEQKSKRAYRTTPTGDGALTPEMIEQCIRLNMDVDSSYAAIGKAKEQFDALNRELTQEGENLKAAKDTVNSSEARTQYDAKVMEYNRRLPQLDQQLNRYKQLVKSYQEKSDKFDRECNGQPYYEDDYAAMVKKLGRGM
ncbi:hypothetical protein [Candidatus Electronema sp. TJ]|uniref:hypothetical protein n=1 Tax=Candidatus Electronema sp. TJ TaxID=3401573 RepID=UPI003AA844AD